MRGPSPDFAAAFQAATKGRVSAVITVSESVEFKLPKQIAEFAIKNRLPSMFENKCLRRGRWPRILFIKRS